ncbi:hypothetical protein DPEC_G00254050 [Dallia pectoralis]|uniref:Uncharacterized protein n=1 Tax=Dallia pectoralis TaxID=75939 RepID=A0ACC2FUH7_DALPE|nr:hypothetical protein DPEC_G00254050 [Dallia pectoralis]
MAGGLTANGMDYQQVFITKGENSTEAHTQDTDGFSSAATEPKHVRPGLLFTLIYRRSQRRASVTNLHRSDSTRLMMSARSKGSGMLGSSAAQKGLSTGASSGGRVWARPE